MFFDFAFYFHKPPSFWLRIGGFNLVLALVLGLFLGLAMRHYAVFLFEKLRGRHGNVRDLIIADIFLIPGIFYALFAWPMLIWDRPARALAAGAIVLVPLVAVLRREKASQPLPRLGAGRGLYPAFCVLLFLTAVFTLMRSGYIALKGDRVPLILDVTGETRVETLPQAPPGAAASPATLTTHHVIIWLPDGEAALDVWAYGDKIAMNGRALIFSHALNRLGVANLYQLLSVDNGAKGGDGPGFFFAPFPDRGPLHVHPWWRPIEDALWRAWEGAFGQDSRLGVRAVDNRSPDYPLVDAEGRPLKRRYLLDLTLEGVATSRGPSPLERR